MPHVVQAYNFMNIGLSSTVLGELDVGMLHDIVLIVYNRPLTPDKDYGLSVVKAANFIRSHKLPSRLLKALGE